MLYSTSTFRCPHVHMSAQSYSLPLATCEHFSLMPSAAMLSRSVLYWDFDNAGANALAHSIIADLMTAAFSLVQDQSLVIVLASQLCSFRSRTCR